MRLCIVFPLTTSLSTFRVPLNCLCAEDLYVSTQFSAGQWPVLSLFVIAEGFICIKFGWLAVAGFSNFTFIFNMTYIGGKLLKTHRACGVGLEALGRFERTAPVGLQLIALCSARHPYFTRTHTHTRMH